MADKDEGFVVIGIMGAIIFIIIGMFAGGGLSDWDTRQKACPLLLEHATASDSISIARQVPVCRKLVTF